MTSLAFDVHSEFEPIPTARVYRAPLMDAEACGEIIRLAGVIGATQARQSADPGLNRVLRVPVNGTETNAVEARLALLEHAFRIHARACELAEEAYGVAITPPPKWKAMPRASPRDRLLGNVTEWNARVKFNMNVLKYTTAGGNVGTTLHRDESPLAFVVPLRRHNVSGGGTHYAHLVDGGVTLNPPAGTLVLHPGDATHRGVPIAARDSSVGPGERWIIAGFLGTVARHAPPRPEPPLTTRRGDVEALTTRWGIDLPTAGCHLDRTGTPRYRKKSGEAGPLRLGSRRRSVYLDTTARRSGRAYRYYVTPQCRKARVLRDVLGALGA